MDISIGLTPYSVLLRHRKVTNMVNLGQRMIVGLFLLTPSYQFSSVQFSTVAQSCPTLCDPMNCSTPGLPVHHHLPEFT